jgi:adenine phosphoribosyltransferase
LSARDEVLARFAWVHGHADVWRLFSDGGAFRTIVRSLAEPFGDATKVAGVEARGFIVGAAVAAELDVGFIAIRKEEGLFPGPKLMRRARPDYRGRENVLRLQREALSDEDRVLLVDDWAERGSQALAAKWLIEECGASFLGLAVVVDQLEDEVRDRIGRIHALVAAEDLGPSA